MRQLRKGWMRWENQTRRIVVDNYGHVFWQGCGGWASPPEGAVLKVLPTQWEHTYWPGSGWWGKNWRSATWAWVYSVPHAT